MARYIILPRQGLRAGKDTEEERVLFDFPFVRSTGRSVTADIESVGAPVDVIDSVAENGPKLVEGDEGLAERINRPGSPVRAVPEVTYQIPRPLEFELTDTTASAGQVVIECLDDQSGQGVPGADVIAVTDLANRIGRRGTTDSSGKVAMQLSGATIEALYIYGPTGYWGAYRDNVAIQSTIQVRLAPVDLQFVDSVRHYYGQSGFDAGPGVTVGILDTGIGPHSILNVTHGINTVTGEPATDWHDGHYHGTHVAGLVGANGLPPAGIRGVAPGVKLHAYRVFGQGGGGATNYAIMKAMIKAEDECDILNLSLGSPATPGFTGVDVIVMESVQAARDNGMLVVIAAGNDGRQPVGTPASYPGAIAVSAMGREGTFPSGSLENKDILRPPASSGEPQEFVAAFSNIGTEIAVTGPGVGTLSTLPNDAFGPLSGTSMAAPVVAGCAASLLSRDALIFSMGRMRARSDAIERLLLSNCVKRGFGLDFEGFGLPDPAAV